MMGAVSSGGGTLIDHYGDAMGKAGQIAANAVLSGTVDELGGGKFANGAITGAFSIMFNDMMHGGPEKSVMDKVHEALDLIGMVPGLDIADGINAVIYVCQGDAGKAALCAVAIIPVVGNVATAGKVAKNIGGRLGNAATRTQINEIAEILEKRGYTILGGGGKKGEEYLKPMANGRKGGSYIDITASHPKYGTLRINTIDVLRDRMTPTARERRNAIRIRKQIGSKNHLLLIPKTR